MKGLWKLETEMKERRKKNMGPYKKYVISLSSLILLHYPVPGFYINEY
jgi:hypothetical protein